MKAIKARRVFDGERGDRRWRGCRRRWRTSMRGAAFDGAATDGCVVAELLMRRCCPG